MSVKERAVMCEIPSLIPSLLSGRKTQGRWIIGRPFSQPVWLEKAGVWSLYEGGIDGGHYLEADFEVIRKALLANCPYGQIGDRLWLREKWGLSGMNRVEYQAYPADGNHFCSVSIWKSPVHMPRKYSRLLLDITDVRVQRLQDISAPDALAQGVHPRDGSDFPDPIGAYADLWNSGVGKMKGCAWADNPWVWALTFRKIEAGNE